MAYQPIENYGIIGDLNTVALVGMNGSIDFLCFPHFDSPSVFAALLDDKKGGRFRIRPSMRGERRRQLYLPDTNVLVTRFLSEDGVAEITDFMPVEEIGFAHDVMRQVRTVRGEVCFEMLCQPRFDYARAEHEVERNGNEVIFTSKGPDQTVLRLRSTVPLKVRDGDAHASFTLKAGETADFILEEVEEGSNAPSIEQGHVPASLDSTVRFWRSWLAGSTYQGRWRETVNRSALALKLLFSRPYGSIVAAPTFGLPEAIGGERNWDYRYMWVRDSAFTLHSLLLLGHREEADAFMKWIEDRSREVAAVRDASGPLQVMYGIDGRTELDEEVLHHLEGYRGSSPVRIGNAAYKQLQLDIYGELMDAIYVFNHHGAPISYDLWRDLSRIVDWIASHWSQPDEGIWEIRGGRREFLYSRVMCWVALDRAIRIAESRSFPGPLDQWMKARDAIYAHIYQDFWNDDRKAFAMYTGTDAMDASSLLMPMVKLISFREPRWISHMAAVESDLVSDSLVYRYRPDQEPDGLDGNEGTFSMCSFWWVENLARAGRIDEARFTFEKMHSFANHLGLYSEELGPTGEFLGNFPQAFTHLGLISAAIALDEALDAAGRDN